ncbi:ACT domain-containing protein [Candidatus Falkowbacteria bacterium]|nr:MAG: ACT domain-containing protein [Candidatus Falkowbacteria bacterium]
MAKKNKTSNMPIITVIGKDTKGIVAQVSNLLWKKDINIEEIKQGIIKGSFFMIMSVDMKDSPTSFHQLSKELKKLGKKINLEINIYNQEIFTAINKI